MLSCGLCPHPASGIRLEFSGNTLNADGIRLGRPPFHLEPPWLFLFINTGSAFPHTGRSAGSVPGPSPGISASTFLWCFHWPDTAFFLKTGHWEIHFSFWLPFDTGGLTLPVCSLYTWFFWSLLRTGKTNWHLPSYSPNSGLHKGIFGPTFLWVFRVPNTQPFHWERYIPLWNHWKISLSHCNWYIWKNSSAYGSHTFGSGPGGTLRWSLLQQLRAVHRYVLGFLSNYSNTFTNSLQVLVHNVPVETSSGVTFQRSPVNITVLSELWVFAYSQILLQATKLA